MEEANGNSKKRPSVEQIDALQPTKKLAVQGALKSDDIIDEVFTQFSYYFDLILSVNFNFSLWLVSRNSWKISKRTHCTGNCRFRGESVNVSKISAPRLNRKSLKYSIESHLSFRSGPRYLFISHL
jgi:hypothetical protein